MAALQAPSALGRSRMTRKPLSAGSNHRPAASSSSSSTAHGHGQTSSLHHAQPSSLRHAIGIGAAEGGSAGLSSLSADIPVASNLSLFVTNLHLLDLDLLEDWPDITAHTFAATTKDATGQGLKRRIQCVEWALYRLFSIWDPDEARNRLQPYFPAHDQVQSINLRAALLRCLEQAKKAGVLGRDAQVRKTMLDECRGDRLEEVLAVFSSAVLKKVVTDTAETESESYPPLAQSIALEQRGYSTDRTQLHALILAYKSSLNALLKDKAAARARYQDFAQLLQTKEKTIARRKAEVEALKAQPDNEVSDEEKLAVWRTLRNNWSGNERWMETLLYGDTGAKRDALLATPFDRVWRRVQAGRVNELEDHSQGLLSQLDARVKAQRERLGRWEKFRERLLTGSLAAERQDKEAETRQRGIDLAFVAHENLRPGRISPRKNVGIQEPRPPLSGEYARILDSLKSELNGGASKPLDVDMLTLASPQKKAQPKQSSKPIPDEEEEEEVISELSEIEEEPRSPHRPVKQPSPPPPTMAAEHPEPAVAHRTRTLAHNRGSWYGDRPQRSTTLSHSGSGSQDPVMEEPPASKRRPLSMTEPVSKRQQSIVNDRLVRTPSMSPERPSASRGRENRRMRNPKRDQPPLAMSPPPQQDLWEDLEQEPAPQRQSYPSPRMSSGTEEVNPYLTGNHETPSPTQGSRETNPYLQGRRETPSPTQMVADEILGAMDEASPSPMKRTLSLQDRTRLSMVRGKTTTGSRRGNDKSKRLVEEDESVRLSISPVKVASSTAKEDDGDAEDGLVARTRKSMAGFEAAQQKAQMERRRSLRREKRTARDGGVVGGRRETVARFLDEMEEEEAQEGGVGREGVDSPRVVVEGVEEHDGGGQGDGEGDYDDSHRGRDPNSVGVGLDGGDGDTTMIAEELIEGDQNDYEAVFMSRPKIKTSPLPSPVRGGRPARDGAVGGKGGAAAASGSSV